MTTRFPTTTILVVEPQFGIRYAIQNSLHFLGFKDVQVADSTQEALRLVARGPREVLICSCELRGKPVPEFIHHVREISVNRDVCVLLYASVASEQMDGLAADLGAHFLPQPFTPDELCSWVDRMAGESLHVNPLFIITRKARAALEMRDYKGVVALTVAYIRKFGESSAIYTLLGTALLALGDVVKAASAFDRANVMAPNVPSILDGQAKVAKLRGADERWCMLVRQAFKLSPDIPRRRAEMGRVLVSEGDRVQAHRLLSAMDLSDESLTDLREVLPKIKFELDQLRQQRDRARTESRGLKYLNAVRLKLRPNRDRDAQLEALTEAIDEFDSAHPMALALAYLERSRWEEAETHMEVALNMEPSLYDRDEVVGYFSGAKARAGG